MYYSCMQVRSHYEVSIFSYRPNHDIIHACYVICSRKKVGESLEKEIKDAEASLSFYTCSLKRLNPIKNISEDTCYFWFNLVRKADEEPRERMHEPRWHSAARTLVKGATAFTL